MPATPIITSRRDRREYRFEQHQQKHACIAGLLDQPDDPVVHQDFAATFASTASQIIRATSLLLNWSMATIPVGDVTLISVSHSPPITSMPTKISPRSFNARTERGADFLFAWREVGCLTSRTADREIGSELALTRHAVDRACHHAIDEHDTLVARGH